MFYEAISQSYLGLFPVLCASYSLLSPYGKVHMTWCYWFDVCDFILISTMCNDNLLGWSNINVSSSLWLPFSYFKSYKNHCSQVGILWYSTYMASCIPYRYVYNECMNVWPHFHGDTFEFRQVWPVLIEICKK